MHTMHVRSVMIFTLLLSFGLCADESIGKELYEALNQDPLDPFVMSVGTSMSQTTQTDNTVNRHAIRKQISKKIAHMKSDDEAVAWMKDKEHIWYVLQSLPRYFCTELNRVVDPALLNLQHDAAVVDEIIKNLVHNRKKQTTLTMTDQTLLGSPVIEQEKIAPTFTRARHDAMLQQLDYLGVNNQSSQLPNVRLSIEPCDCLMDGTDMIDPEKMQRSAAFIKKFGNPLVFFHHYANPASKSHLFSSAHDVDWFANYCGHMIAANPQITHASPMSQPMGFYSRVTRETLPPFDHMFKSDTFFKHLMDAQVQAALKMKKANPKLKVLLSHQWKLMKPKHTSLADPRYFLERAISSIADRMYNQKLVSAIMPNIDNFDGIALSIYPPLRFNLWIPEGNNCSGNFDSAEILETIIETHKAFPGKDIYIVETGANTPDPEIKKDFIDKTLLACKQARELNIPVKAVYFWCITNDSDFYAEWNFPPGTTNFGPFDRLDPHHPTASINAGGEYMRDILKH